MYALLEYGILYGKQSTLKLPYFMPRYVFLDYRRLLLSASRERPFAHVHSTFDYVPAAKNNKVRARDEFTH